MEERKPEARAVPESERMRGAEPMAPMGEVTPMMRAGAVPAWYSRISWGAIFAGVFIAIATQLVLYSFVTWIGLVSSPPTSVAGISNALTSLGIWTGISALIALFVGAWAASAIASVQFSSDGLWHGAVVWAFTLVLGIALGAFGIVGLIGLGTSALSLIRLAVPAGASISPTDIATVAALTGRAAGWFLLGSLLTLGTALLGGWLGSRRMNRAEAARMEAGRTRMAA